MTWFHRPFEKVYVPSESTKQKLLTQQIHHNIELWGRGVNHQFFSPLKTTSQVRKKFNIKEKHLLLFVGRIAPEKDIHVVLETFLSLPNQLQKDTHLLIVGDGPLFEKLSEQTHDQITWTGFMEGEALAEIYASSDAFIFPSSTETFGNVVLEAQSSGLPVIGAKAGGVQHLINHGENGFLCEAQNVNDFVRHTTKILENSDLRRRFGYEARQFALSQSWEHIFEQLIGSFQEVSQKQKRFSA